MAALMKFRPALICLAFTFLSQGQHNARGASDLGDGLRNWPDFGAVYSVRRSADGLLWLATAQGVQRFDGLNFVSFPLPNELAGDARVRLVVPASSGDLWVATTSAADGIHQGADGAPVPKPWGTLALARLRGGQWRIWRRADGLPSERVLALHEDSHGRIWVGTDAGLARLEGEHFVAMEFDGPASTKPRFVSAIAEQQGTLAIGTDNGIWMAEADGKFTLRYATGATVAIAFGDDNIMWAGTTDWLVRASPDGQIRRVSGPGFQGVHWMKRNRNGTFWASTGDGLFRVNESTMVASLTVAVPFTADTVDDAEGSLWFASRAFGLVVSSPQRATMVPNEQFTTAFAVLPLRSGAVWMTSVTGLQSWSEGQLTTYPLPPEHTWSLRGLAEAKDGTVWVVSMPHSLLHFQGADFETYPMPGLRGVFVDKSGGLWLSWNKGGLTQYADGEPNSHRLDITPSDGLCAGGITAFAQGASGKLYFAGGGGVSIVQAGHASCISQAQGLPGLPAYAVHEDSDGDVWIGTAATAGLARLHGGRIEPVPVGTLLGAGPVFGIVEDNLGALWFTSDHGVLRILRKQIAELIDDETVRSTAEVYGVEEGMTASECTAAFAPSLSIDAKGDIWAPTIAGSVMITPPERSPARQTAAVITGLDLGGHFTAWPIPPVIEGLSGASLTIQVAAPTAISPRRLSFQHQLQGMDTGWQATSASRQVRYANLPPGDLRFMVRVLDESGAPLGPTATVRIRAHRRWVPAAAMILFAMMLAAASALAAHRWRVRRINARHKLVDDERRRIARDLHDGLAQGFIGIRLQLSVVRALTDNIHTAAHGALASAFEVLEWTQRQLRSAVWALRNPDSRGVSSAVLVTRVVDEFRLQTAVQVRCHADEPSPLLSGAIEHEIGQIVREALTNVAKHAGAAQATVTVRSERENLRIEICDDGCGFDATASTGGGAGLLGMRERASRIGGAVSITSDPASGTRLSVQVPISVVRNEDLE